MNVRLSYWFHSFRNLNLFLTEYRNSIGRDILGEKNKMNSDFSNVLSPYVYMYFVCRRNFFLVDIIPWSKCKGNFFMDLNFVHHQNLTFLLSISHEFFFSFLFVFSARYDFPNMRGLLVGYVSNIDTGLCLVKSWFNSLSQVFRGTSDVTRAEPMANEISRIASAVASLSR